MTTTLERVLFWACVLATAVPLVSTRYLPFTDLPEHVAVMSTLSRWFDATSGEAATYQIAFWKSQYLGYHGAGAMLTRITGDAILANRLLLLGVALALPLSVRAALRALGRDEGMAILAAMPFLSRPLFVGFLPYVASLPLYFAGIALLARRARGPRHPRRVAALLAAVTLALVYTHLSAFAVFVVTAIVLELILAAQDSHAPASSSTMRWLAARGRALVWLVPGACIAATWSVVSRITLSADSLAAPQELGSMRTARALRALPLWAFDVFQSHLDELCGALWWTALACFAVLGMRRLAPASAPARPAASTQPRAIRLLARIDPAYVPLLCVMVAYLLTPFRVGAGGMLNVRLAPLVALTATLTVTRSRGKLRAAVLGMASLATVVHAANATWQIRAMAAEHMTGFDAVLDAMRPGTRLVTLAFDARRSHTHIDPYPFVGSYHRARGGRVASYSFSDLAHWPVQYRTESRPPPKPYPLWIYAPCEYRHGIDGAYYDYVLVSGDLDPFARKPSGPAFRELRRIRGFVLYEKVADEIWSGSSSDGSPCPPPP